MNPKQLRELIIRPVLEYLHPDIPYSHEAEDLLMMTCAHESNMGEYIAQVGGPALGIYQMEAATEKDIWENYLRYKPRLGDYVGQTQIKDFYNFLVWREGQDLVGNLWYATAMARVHYYRVPEALPRKSDFVEEDVFKEKAYLFSLAEYAKKHYNTELGKAEARDYYDKYIKYVRGRDV